MATTDKISEIMAPAMADGRDGPGGPVDGLDLFGDAAASLNLGADGPLGRGVVAAPVNKGRGRPAGSMNRRTQALADVLLAMHRHPVQAAAELYSMPADELLARLGVDFKADGRMTADQAIKVLGLQLKAMEFVARYVASPMPGQAAEASQGKPPLQVAIMLGNNRAKDGALVRSHADGGAENGGDGVELIGAAGAILDAWSDGD